MAAFLVQALSFVAQIGASYLLSRFTAQSQKPSEDLSAKNGDYGVPIPRVYGAAARYSVPYMAQADIEETEHTVQDYSEVVGAISGAATGFLIGGPVGAVIGGIVGGIFGGAAPDQKYYTYSDTFALLLADRSADDPVEALLKIWAAGRVIFDASEQAHESQVLNSGVLVSRTWGQNRYFASLTLYTGHPAQGVDPVLASAISEDCAYRPLAYVVVEDLQLEHFGNSMPGEFEALVQAKSGQSLAEVAEAVAAAAGIDVARDLSTTALAGLPVRGYAFTAQANCWDVLAPLMPVFRVDAGEVAGQVRFTTRERGLRATIPLSAMGAHEYGSDAPDLLTWSRADEKDLPRETSLTFIDPARDYLPNTATSRRSEGSAKSNVATTLALTLTATEGATAASTMHWDAWLGRTSVQTTLADPWDCLTPGICFALPFEDGDLRQYLPYRMTRKSRGANGLVEAEFTSAENVAFTGTVTGGSGTVAPPPTTLLPDTRIVPMDMPISEDLHDDFGFYVAMAGTTTAWNRGRVEVSSDGVSYATLLDGTSAAVIGDVTGALEVGPTSGWDDTLDTESVLTVTLLHSRMQLGSCSDDDLDAWKNFAFVGQDGQGEYLQFKTATNISGNVWELTNLRRGRRGTDWAMEHEAGDEFVLLGEGGVYRVLANDGTGWGDEIVLRGVTQHQDPLLADTVVFVNTGEGKKPFSVIEVMGSFDGGGDLTITWESRPRLFSGVIDAPESYELDIYRSGVFKRTITVAVEEALYSAAEQATDGFTDGDAIFIEIYQVNVDYGRGHVREVAFLPPSYTMHMEDDITPILMEDGITPIGLG